LGIAYLNTGSYNKAEQALNGALSMNQKMANAYYALAETYQKLGKQEEEKYCRQKFQELGGGR
jgi:Tfp pilus assembly protein PilF